MDTIQLLNQIETKITKLKARNERLTKENESLQQSIFDYIAKMEQFQKEANNNSSQLKASATVQATQLDTKKLRKDIDKYIYMIDKCIASVKVKE